MAGNPYKGLSFARFLHKEGSRVTVRPDAPEKQMLEGFEMTCAGNHNVALRYAVTAKGEMFAVHGVKCPSCPDRKTRLCATDQAKDALERRHVSVSAWASISRRNPDFV